jgi:hypothetical protein
MRSAERELMEIERKRQLNESKDGASALKSSSDLARLRIKEVSKQLEDETRKLSLARAQIKKVKGQINPKEENQVEERVKVQKQSVFAESSPTKVSSTTASKKTTGNTRGAVSNPVPEELFPELCRVLVDARGDGMNRVVERFHERYSNISKRQIELAIEKLAFKDKREQDTTKVWYIRPEYEDLFLGKESGKKRTREDETKASTDAPGKAPSEPKKFKRAFGFFVKDKRAEAEAILGIDSSVSFVQVLISIELHDLN